MSKRKVCRTCYNKEKVIQRQYRFPIERVEECRKCCKIKTIPKGKIWCRECKNYYEKLRKSKFTETKKKKKNKSVKNILKRLKKMSAKLLLILLKPKYVLFVMKIKH